jgi:hypothetical protein
MLRFQSVSWLIAYISRSSWPDPFSYRPLPTVTFYHKAHRLLSRLTHLSNIPRFLVNQQTRLTDMPRYRPGSHVSHAQRWHPIFTSTLIVLFALSNVLRVSFVCSLTLVHVFRGSLWVFCFFALLPVVSSPYAYPRGVGRLWALCVWLVSWVDGEVPL